MALRILALTGWLLVLVGGATYHLSAAGTAGEKLDVTAVAVAAAEAAAASDDYLTAIDQYDAALKALPEGRTAEQRKIRLERAKAMMLAKQLPEANGDLAALVDELTADKSADPKLLAEARSAYANSQYYTTWLMRLEGLTQETWEPEIEAARQVYKLLAETATDPAVAAKAKDDLEAAVRLARMDLSELQGLNLPKQCQGCCSCKGKKPSKKEGKKPKQDVRSAGGAPELDESGH